MGTISWGVGTVALRRQIALMLQRAVPFADTVRDNLRLAEVSGRAVLDDAALWRVLEQVGLADEIRAAGGVDVLVGEARLSLSSRQARRLVLARTLLIGAPVLVLDEPTAGLDPAVETEFWRGLRARADGRALLIIAHGVDLEGFDRILELRDGKLHSAADSGSTEQIDVTRNLAACRV